MAGDGDPKDSESRDGKSWGGNGADIVEQEGQSYTEKQGRR